LADAYSEHCRKSLKPLSLPWRNMPYTRILFCFALICETIFPK
jgi:hypothetical protein